MHIYLLLIPTYQGYEGKIRIEVDGGVGVANIKEVAEAGADMFVAGSAILKVNHLLIERTDR